MARWIAWIPGKNHEAQNLEQNTRFPLPVEPRTGCAGMTKRVASTSMLTPRTINNSQWHYCPS
jgi:hypothetical protein